MAFRLLDSPKEESTCETIDLIKLESTGKNSSIFVFASVICFTRELVNHPPWVIGAIFEPRSFMTLLIMSITSDTLVIDFTAFLASVGLIFPLSSFEKVTIVSK